METSYLLAVQASLVGLYCDIPTAGNVEAVALYLLDVTFICVGGDHFFDLSRCNLSIH